jgi:uracil phosphoribosyltransferase
VDSRRIEADERYPNVMVISHPLVQQKLTTARDVRTPSQDFRRLLGEIAMLMAYELTRDHAITPVEVQSPMGLAAGATLESEITLVPILRAGLGMADGILRLIPQARVGHLGIYRDETSLKPVVYYNKLPPEVATSEVILIDPMLATGGSSAVAVDAIKRTGATRVKLLCLVAAPEGIEHVRLAHPDLVIYTAAIDSHLNEQGYIVPGLGDAGDRIFGTE